MQRATARATIIVALRERVNTHVAGHLGDQECVHIAIAASMRDPDDVVGFLIPTHLAKLAVRARDSFKISQYEWSVLFGQGTQSIRDGGISEIVASSEFVAFSKSLSNALKTTVCEKEQAVAWANARTRLLCFISMHLEFADEALVAVLGTVIKADSRRIEEFYNQLDDDGPDVLLIVRCLSSLCASLG